MAKTPNRTCPRWPSRRLEIIWMTVNKWDVCKCRQRSLNAAKVSSFCFCVQFASTDRTEAAAVASVFLLQVVCITNSQRQRWGSSSRSAHILCYNLIQKQSLDSLCSVTEGQYLQRARTAPPRHPQRNRQMVQISDRRAISPVGEPSWAPVGLRTETGRFKGMPEGQRQTFNTSVSWFPQITWISVITSCVCAVHELRSCIIQK